jgi:hypothetical protein
MKWLRLFLLAVLCLPMMACTAPDAEAGVATQPQQVGLPTDSFAEPAVTLPPVVVETSPAVSTAAAATAPTLPRVTTGSASPTPTFDPAAWTTLPVLPKLSPRALAVLQDGLARGRNPRAFSKLGDCESQAYWFLGELDEPVKVYSLGPYEEELAPVVEFYAGSFKRSSLAAQPGFSAASLMAPIWADKKQCEKDETPIACEFRIHNPLVTFIMLGSNDASNPKTFEGHMRRAIEYSLEQGVLPILGTKADNVEGDHRINSTIARLAYEYELPLWNYWLAVQDLPNAGLQEDGVHLTFGSIRFDDPAMMKTGWTVRNLNALQVLEIIMDASPAP